MERETEKQRAQMGMVKNLPELIRTLVWYMQCLLLSAGSADNHIQTFIGYTNTSI